MHTKSGKVLPDPSEKGEGLKGVFEAHVIGKQNAPARQASTSHVKPST